MRANYTLMADADHTANAATAANQQLTACMLLAFDMNSGFQGS